MPASGWAFYFCRNRKPRQDWSGSRWPEPRLSHVMHPSRMRLLPWGTFAALDTNPECAIRRGLRVDPGLFQPSSVSAPAELRQQRWRGEKARSSQTCNKDHVTHASRDFVQGIDGDQGCGHDPCDHGRQAFFAPEEIGARPRPAENRLRAGPADPGSPYPRALLERRGDRQVDPCVRRRDAPLSSRSRLAVKDRARLTGADQPWPRPQQRSPAQSRKRHDQRPGATTISNRDPGRTTHTSRDKPRTV